MTVKLMGLYAGKGHKFTAQIESGINSKIAMQQLQVFEDRIDGDARFDLKNHGGNERVLHHFPQEHYAFFKQQGLMSEARQAPALGENISTLGLCEQDVCIGDEIAFGEVLLQITLPRAPCFKTNLQFRQREFARTMQDTTRCGWLYRVLTPGTINRTDEIRLVTRHCNITVADAIQLYFAAEFDADKYQRLLGAHKLGQDWQSNLHKRLKNQTLENWNGRLYGPETLYEGW